MILNRNLFFIWQLKGFCGGMPVKGVCTHYWATPRLNAKGANQKDEALIIQGLLSSAHF